MRIGHFATVLVMSACLAGGGTVFAAEDIVLRTAVTPEEAWVGQQVVLHVDVLAKDAWAQLGKSAGIEVDGAYLLDLESQGVRLSETIDGESYTGQRYSFMLFAQRDGKLSVQSVPVEVQIRTWGAGGGTRTEQRTLPSVEFVARTPTGAEGIRGLISTSKLTVSQNWKPKIVSAVVGDAIKRQITMHADDVSGMAFAPTLHRSIDDIGIYPGQPTVEDKFARGDLTGTRVETVTYVFERAGNFDIPAVELTWWNVRKEELQHIVLPGLTIDVGGGAVADATTLVIAEQQRNDQLLRRALVALFVVFGGLLVFGRHFVTHWKAWRNARNETEAVYFRRIRKSAKSGDPDAVLRDTMRWLDRINDAALPARLDLFMQKYGGSGDWQVTRNDNTAGIGIFFDQLVAARERWRRTGRGGKQGRDLLPNLNA